MRAAIGEAETWVERRLIRGSTLYPVSSDRVVMFVRGEYRQRVLGALAGKMVASVAEGATGKDIIATLRDAKAPGKNWRPIPIVALDWCHEALSRGNAILIDMLDADRIVAAPWADTATLLASSNPDHPTRYAVLTYPEATP